jgi:isopenicillin N synthase-like dioxygenase
MEKLSMNAQESQAQVPDKVVILDMAHLRHPDIEVRRGLGRELVRACIDVGFFYIVNHGIPELQIDGMFELSRRFFDLPAKEKQDLSMAKNEYFSGYLPMKLSGDASMKGTSMEAFHAWQEPPGGRTQTFAGKLMNDANVWPSQIPTMRSEVARYVDSVSELTRDLLRIAALGIGLEETVFLQYFRSPLSLLRLIHYPPQTPSDQVDGRFGIRPHTDNCALTLLSQDDTGGLQILGNGLNWVDVTPVPGSYVVNIGETMKLWTNGLFKATPHRVINRSGKQRYSVAFFMNADDDAQIAPMLQEAQNGAVEPIFHSTVALDEGATAGEVLHRLYSRIYPTRSSHHST